MSEAKIISIANQKGGVGKSSQTIANATALASPPFNYRVCVVDCDPQANVTKNRTKEEKVYNSKGIEIPENAWDLITTNLVDLPKVILNKETLNKYDLIFIDIPGMMVLDGIGALLKLSDFILIPLKPTIDDIDSSTEFYQTVMKAKKWRESKNLPMDVHGVISMPRGTKNILTVKKHMERKYELPMFDTVYKAYTEFENRSTYKSMYEGKTNACFNLRALVNEFIEKANIN